MSGPMPLLDVRGLQVGFAGKPVVHGLDLQIAPGEKLALVGESGSGKSITALSLLRLLPQAQVSGQEAATALLSDTTLAGKLFGYPLVPLGAMLDWVADWVKREQPAHGKPTKFEVRDGAF